MTARQHGLAFAAGAVSFYPLCAAALVLTTNKKLFSTHGIAGNVKAALVSPAVALVGATLVYSSVLRALERRDLLAQLRNSGSAK